ncbi:MAG: hypothetical protein QOE70_4332 [Chthoniobacter sp.]|jgi:hypothetical protein|nr:hypothetical protein [Chthoniobacter sp.]
MKERIRQLLHAAPFQPFVIRMADGSTHVVTHPDFVLAASDHPHVVVEEPTGNIHYLSVLLIVSVTLLIEPQKQVA